MGFCLLVELSFGNEVNCITAVMKIQLLATNKVTPETSKWLILKKSPMKFKSSLDYLAKIVTIVVTILFAAIIVVQISILVDNYSLTPILIIAALLITYFGTYAYRPVSYILTDAKIIIHRPLFDKVIERSEIKSVEQLVSGELRWAMRTFGIGGLFGYFGKFYTGNIGSMTWYATRRDIAVLIKTTSNKNIIVTPDDYQNFVSELLK